MKVGDILKVKIADIDVSKSKVILDKKALLESPLSLFKAKYKQNDIIEGIVKNTPDFGIFVDSGNEVDIFIPNSELYPKKSEDYKKGDKIEAVLTRITDKVSASVKQLERQREKSELDESMAEFNNDNSFTFMDAVKRKSNRK